MAELQRQRFVIARVADYCDYRRLDISHTGDPLLYLWGKLEEMEKPMYQLKQDLLDDTVREFFAKAKNGGINEEDLTELRQFLDRFLAPGDFADASFHLDLQTLADSRQRQWAEKCLTQLRTQQLLQEESKPEDKRNPFWEKLVREMYRRLDFDLLERVLTHKPIKPSRLRFILRRCRRNSYDYCAVFHLPLHPQDTFTPFILPRVEALVAANRRFLRKIRRF